MLNVWKIIMEDSKSTIELSIARLNCGKCGHTTMPGTRVVESLNKILVVCSHCGDAQLTEIKLWNFHAYLLERPRPTYSPYAWLMMGAAFGVIIQTILWKIIAHFIH